MSVGSSPRLRGTPLVVHFAVPHGRFIPAFAGNTIDPDRGYRARPVHPRVCGEHRAWVPQMRRRVGSSPRLRGTPGDSAAGGRALRFIPAFAGNTSSAPQARHRPSVHPRVCGEHTATGTRDATSVGSSPRLRGTRSISHSCSARCRFIPAFAGNTPPVIIQGRGWPVHPRVCGEHCGIRTETVSNFGSSPRLRGTPAVTQRHVYGWRFIPAFAGNTIAAEEHDPALPVHPRVCGEHTEIASASMASAGSSPRLRGTLLLLMVVSLVRRFIPAFAGNTHPRPMCSP